MAAVVGAVVAHLGPSRTEVASRRGEFFLLLSLAALLLCQIWPAFAGLCRNLPGANPVWLPASQISESSTQERNFDATRVSKRL